MFYETDWTTRVDYQKIRQERLARARSMMIKHKLDALIALKFENTRYITGLRPLWFPFVQLRNAAVLTPDAEIPLCFVSGGDWEHRQATMKWLPPENVRICPSLEDPSLVSKGLPSIVQGLKEMGFTKGRVGLDVAYLYLLDSLRELLPGSEIVDCDQCLREARLIKGEEELKAFEVACNCVELGFSAALEAAAVGRRECEILGEVMKRFYSLGMEVPQCNLIVASGDNTAPLARFASDRIVMNGDLVFMDLGGCFNGMFAEATRTVVCGKPSSIHKEIYKVVYEALQMAVAEIKPGVSSEKAQQAVARVFDRAGFGDKALKTVLGHSIGVGGWEPPTIGDPKVSGDAFEFAPGMVFSLEPTIIYHGLPGGGGVRLEDEILVTPSGCRMLTRIPYAEELLK